MIKTLLTATVSAAAAGLASAAPLPAPPTEVYTPASQPACSSETFQIYFPAGTSALTPASRAMLGAVQARLDGCVLGRVSLQASADDARNLSEAERLSAARIEAVSAALANYQLDGMRVTADPALGARDALWTPMDRRVEIHLTAWAPEIS